MRTGCDNDTLTAKGTTSSRWWGNYLKQQTGTEGWIFPGLLVWLAFVKLPSPVNLGVPQPWEPVLSFAAAHHLQWGRDLVFTYGPLAFLTTDYYWGSHFWPMLLWSFGFSAVLTFGLLRFVKRLILPIRMVLYIGLLLLTVPRLEDLGIDPIYLFAITLFGVACLPKERPGALWLTVSGVMFGLLSLIKFTFCLYVILVLLTITAAHLFHRRFWPSGIVLGSAVVSFLAAWLTAAQSISNIGPWFQYSLQISSGYSSAMTLPMINPHLVLLGVLTCLSLAGLLLVHWHGSRERRGQVPGMGLLAAGIFLAWKEGFVRADVFHVAAFQIYAVLIAVTMPALLGVVWERRALFLSLTITTLALALAPFALAPSAGQESTLAAAIKAGAVPKLTDTFTALFRPVAFKHRLEANLESRRSLVLLPQIAAILGDTPVGVLNYDQHVAILNGFNYRPQPVFEDYSAYTPELQQLNSVFFSSAEAPEYVLWRYGTLDFRFPTLDDGQIILTILGSYLPVAEEGEHVLWQRNASLSRGYSLVNHDTINAVLDQWIPIPADATWLRIELQETWFETVRRFFYRASVPAIEVRLEDGRTIKYRLPPGYARSGFIVNPLLDSKPDLLLPFLKQGKPRRVTAVRVHSSRWCFNDAVHYVVEKIEGIPMLQSEPEAGPSPIIPAPPPSIAP